MKAMLNAVVGMPVTGKRDLRTDSEYERRQKGDHVFAGTSPNRVFHLIPFNLLIELGTAERCPCGTNSPAIGRSDFWITPSNGKQGRV
ncbi:MAG: hypothetical protein ACRDKE_06425 [Solirubrobacterales bacterium]